MLEAYFTWFDIFVSKLSHFEQKQITTVIEIIKTERLQFEAIYLFSSPFESVYFSRCVIGTFHTATILEFRNGLLSALKATADSGNILFFATKHLDVIYTTSTDSASLIWLRPHAASFAYKLAWKLKKVRLVYGDECSSNSRGKDVGSAVTVQKRWRELWRILIEIT